MTSRRLLDVRSYPLPGTHRFQAPSLETEPSLPELIGIARRTLMRARRGALATISPAGSPLGSILPFAVDEVHCPYFALHGWADHASHLVRDDRCSLLVVDPSRDAEPADAARPATKVTLVGRAHLIAGDVAAAARAALGAPAGHQIYRLVVAKIRVVSGGRSSWVSSRPAQRRDAI